MFPVNQELHRDIRNPGGPIQFQTASPGIPGGSRLLLHADWAKASKQFGGHLIVAAPSAEELLYADGSSAEAIDALSALAHDRFAKAERGISPSVFEWQPERWVVVAR